MKKKIITVLIFIGLIWAVFIIDAIFPGDFTEYGLRPRTISGLLGIISCPLLHGSLGHLISNTIPLAVFLFALFMFYEKQAVLVIVLSVLLGGLLVWIFARNAVHIGASGLIYSLAAFLITSGIILRKFKLLVVSVVLIILYGGLIWGVFPGITGPSVSFEGHLFGAAAGAILAFVFKKRTTPIQAS